MSPGGSQTVRAGGDTENQKLTSAESFTETASALANEMKGFLEDIQCADRVQVSYWCKWGKRVCAEQVKPTEEEVKLK